MSSAVPIIYARRSSHMSRVLLFFSAEFGVVHEFRPVRSLLSQESEDYGGNPALKLPSMHVAGERFFGALNCCRRLWKLVDRRPNIVWPEDLDSALTINALETVQNGMGSEVVLILNQPPTGAAASAGLIKTRASLLGGLRWLEARLPEILDDLSEHLALSFLEVCLFCYLDHLEWRQVQSLEDFPRLATFRNTFNQLPAAIATAYRFDQPTVGG